MPLLQPKLETYQYQDTVVRYRPGSTDMKSIREVLERQEYRRASIDFDVEAGEDWLDLGANIGAFAVYCLGRGAAVTCYEPEQSNYDILCRNVGSSCSVIRACVSTSQSVELPMWSSNRRLNYYRGTIIGPVGAMQETPVTVRNVFIGSLGEYDGIKMDIEGAELAILDSEALPKCNKLCMEYHLSRDRSVENLKRRVEYLRRTFDTVVLHAETRQILRKGVDDKGWQDRIMFCVGRK